MSHHVLSSPEIQPDVHEPPGNLADVIAHLWLWACQQEEDEDQGHDEQDAHYRHDDLRHEVQHNDEAVAHGSDDDAGNEHEVLAHNEQRGHQHKRNVPHGEQHFEHTRS